MIIKHKIDAFLNEIFPATKGLKSSELESYFCEYYSSKIKIEKENYTIPFIPNKTFTGKQFLRWLYVSWAIAIPEQLGKMGLKFQKEFEVAKSVGGNKTR